MSLVYTYFISFYAIKDGVKTFDNSVIDRATLIKTKAHILELQDELKDEVKADELIFISCQVIDTPDLDNYHS